MICFVVLFLCLIDASVFFSSSLHMFLFIRSGDPVVLGLVFKMYVLFIYLFIFFYFFTYTKCAFYGNLWAKGDHVMETSYLKAHRFGNRYPEWTPNLYSDRGQDLNPCARGSQGLQSTSGSTVPRFLCLIDARVCVSSPACMYLYS